jgi:5S rRNA maturation endonuclease (ribonuclease M5)
MSTSPQVQNLLDRLEGVKETSTGWQARCPCRNDDQNPSLVVSEGNDGRALVHCHRGVCDVGAICTSVGIKVADLMPEKQLEKKKEYITFVKAYDYVDEEWNLLFQKVRYIDQDGKKTFRQRKPVGNGKDEWVYSLGDTPKVLYNLPLVAQAIKNGDRVFLVEGEKDADTLTEKGVIATTMPGGAGKWLNIHTETLRGGYITIIADNDEPGKNHAKLVSQELSAAGCSVIVMHSPTSKDITDHIVAGGRFSDLVELRFDGDADKPQAEAVEEAEKSAEELALEKISLLLSRDDMSLIQKIAKTYSILESTSSEKPVNTGRLVLWDEFVKESDDDSYDWIIPGLLERSERVIIVAAEGVGKTMLARQVAILSSCGIHPFTLQDIKPVRTLTIDLENPERIIRRTSRRILEAAVSRSRMKNPSNYLYTQPAGLDLLKKEDRMLLEQQIEEAKPELLVLGPLYKSFVDPGGRTSEAVALEVAKYLDSIRTIYGCALWLEHHAPLGTSMTTRDLRPFGSAVWSRWPEFGISITPDFTAPTPYVYDLRHFRGARDERQWPTKITRGKMFPFHVLEFAKVST